MVNLRKFCISDELFSGFETMVDLDEVQSIDGIIISNTTLSRPNSLLSSYKDEVGGLSGKPIFFIPSLSNVLI